MKKSLVSDIRYVFPKPGKKGTLHYQCVTAIDVWPEGTEIQVLEVKHLDGVIIKDAAGRLTRVPHFCLNMGREYEMDGVWLRENHPLVLDHLEICLAQEQHTRYAPAAQVQMDAYRRKLEEILRLHGRLGTPFSAERELCPKPVAKRSVVLKKVSGV